jgi:hypothetical protein
VYRGRSPVHQATFVRRSAFETHGRYDVSLGTTADYEWFARFATRAIGRTHYFDRVIVDFAHGGLTSRSQYRNFVGRRKVAARYFPFRARMRLALRAPAELAGLGLLALIRGTGLHRLIRRARIRLISAKGRAG